MATTSHFLSLVLFGTCLLGQDNAVASRASELKTDLLAHGLEIGAEVHHDDFASGLAQWSAELEKPGRIEAKDGHLEIDVPAGCSLWFKSRIQGAVLIEYEAVMVSTGGPNDRVSDLNSFWMANDSRNPDDLFATKRSGKFSDYDRLTCYYAGIGGNTNSTTRFRRYIGESGNRPLLPEHDLQAPRYLLRANESQTIQLIAAGPFIACYRNGERLFQLDDATPYTSGWFAFRTVTSHIIMKNFRVTELTPIKPKA